ncbi:MAG: translocation/assembly module TamB, partial [Armatimonadetes bacterium]|nr:translocation/assembly module TamB [Armatimonadota bacterium]
FPIPRSGLVSGNVSLKGPLSELVTSMDLSGDAVVFGGTTFDTVRLDATFAPRTVRIEEFLATAPGIRLTGEGALGRAAGPFPGARAAEPDEQRPLELVLRMEDTQIQRLVQTVQGIPALRRTRLGEQILPVANTPRTPLTGELDMRLAVAGPMDDLQGDLDFNVDSLQVGAQEFEVAQGSFAINGRRLVVQSLRIVENEEDGAIVTASGTGAYAGDLNFVLRVNNLDLQTLAPWLGVGRAGRDLRGKIEVMRVEITGTRDDPILQASLLARNVGTGRNVVDEVNAPDIHAEDGMLTIGQLLIRKEVSEQEGTEVQSVVYGSLPFTIYPLDFPKNGPLDLHARVDEQNLGLLAVFFPMIQDAGGTFGGDLHVTGTMAKPVASGSFALRDGSVQLAQFKNRFTDLNGRVTFDKDRIVLPEFRGASSMGGSFVMAGSASLVRFPNGPVQLTIRTDEALAMEARNASQIFDEQFEGRVEADVAVTGTLIQPTVRGFVLARNGTLELPETPLTGTPQAATLPLPNPTFDNFRLVAGEGFMVKRGTLQAEMNGELLVDGQYPISIEGETTGQEDLLTAVGRFTIDRGRVRVATRTFRIQDGSTVTFAYRAPDPPRIRMDIEAMTRVYGVSGLDRERRQYQVTVNLTGPLENPNISFESDPPGLNRRQILGALGYQAELEAIFRGGSEADRALRQGLAQAFTGAVAPAFFEPIESAFVRALNLEEFSLFYDLESPLQVQITKHLFNKFYLTYRRELNAGDPDYMLKIYYRVTPRINLSYVTDERNINTFLIEGRFRF